jgi:hypothetical protein
MVALRFLIFLLRGKSMKRNSLVKAFALVGLLAYAIAAIPMSKTLCRGFVPQNNLKIPVGARTHFGITGGPGITEDQYNAIMDRLESIYAPVIKQRGGTFVINRLWTDDTVNSSAEQQGNQWIINMYGGIARHPDVTIEGEALIACHETGHHLGGAPKESGLGGSWATDEGGADYFATLKCLRNFFAQDDNATILSGMTLDPVAVSKCEAQFTAKTDQDICKRISLSAQSVSYLFQDLSSEKTRPSFATPDPSQVSVTNDDHPATQCRMDTYFNGDICAVAASVPNSDTDFKAGTCVQGVDAMGYRPRCWFQPDSSSGGGGGGGGCPFGDPSICQQICQLDPSEPFCTQLHTIFY